MNSHASAQVPYLVCILISEGPLLSTEFSGSGTFQYIVPPNVKINRYLEFLLFEALVGH